MIKAVNSFLFVTLDPPSETVGELWIPVEGRAKTTTGTVLAVGKLVKDDNIKAAKGKKIMFHAGVGFSISYEGVEYQVLVGEEVIAIL